jgi:hypothetical protein
LEQELPVQIQRGLDEAAAIEARIAEEQAALAAQDTTNTEATEVQAAEVKEPEPETKLKALPDASEETWEKRFIALQGKFTAEVPRYAEQLRKANESIESLRKQNELLMQAPEPQEVQKVTSEDEEAFGSDLIELVRKVSKQEAAQAAKTATAEVQKVANKIQSVEQAQAATAGDRFMSEVATAVPDWEVVNADSRWLDWLGEYSPETGAPRQVALDHAQSNLDSARTIALFNTFKRTLPAPEVKTVSAQEKAQQELKSQVAPAKTAASAPKANTERIWSGKEYEQAFDVRNSRVMTTPELDAIQAEAERAYLEGRVRW